MGTKFKGDTESKIILDTFIKFFRSSESIKVKLSNFIEESGLTDGQFYVLDVLYHLGNLSQKELAIKIMRSEGNVTMIIRNLLQRKLIKRTRKKDDRRVAVISITEKGKEEYEKLFPKFLLAVKGEFSILNYEEQKTFQELCKKLGLSSKTFHD